MPLSFRSVSGEELYNLLQAQKNWPSGGAPALFDLRDEKAYGKRHVRAAHRMALNEAGDLDEREVAARAWMDRVVCLYDSVPERLEDHAVAQAFIREGNARELIVLDESFDAFRERYPFLVARGDSRSAMKRPIFPSCVIPGLLYLGDLTDAAALPRLTEQLNIRCCVTALAELPPSLKASVAESGVEHTWCNVRDVEEADIKEHFAVAYEKIEACRAAGTAAFVHCSRGVSRSASLCIAYLMRKEGWGVERAHEHVRTRRPIVLPNAGFLRCLGEFEKERSGERSGVYVPAKTKAIDELEFELPPPWAAEPTLGQRAKLVVQKAGEVVDELEVGEHQMYTFGRSLTCDFPLDHPSISRQHAALVHHENGGIYVIDLKSSHCTAINAKPLRPFEAALLREGASVSFGASSRTYRLVGLELPKQAASAAGPSSAAAAVEGPHLPAAAAAGSGSSARKRERESQREKWKAHKKKKWLDGPKSSKQMTENERVARGAGGGSGCFGPGFD